MHWLFTELPKSRYKNSFLTFEIEKNTLTKTPPFIKNKVQLGNLAQFVNIFQIPRYLQGTLKANHNLDLNVSKCVLECLLFYHMLSEIRFITFLFSWSFSRKYRNYTLNAYNCYKRWNIYMHLPKKVCWWYCSKVDLVFSINFYFRQSKNETTYFHFFMLRITFLHASLLT